MNKMCTKSEPELLDKFIDGIIQIFQYLIVSAFDGIYKAMADVILQNDFADIVDGRADGSNLNQNLTAVSSVFDHSFDSFHMTDGAVHAVEHGLCIGVTVRMGMCMRMHMIFFHWGYLVSALRRAGKVTFAGTAGA